ncbi:hypothetical protein LTR08_002343 [Meristemomyces frigidus]|nr:hypothetical protein LTR08_002343 [Meristemomyces frigidus]
MTDRSMRDPPRDSLTEAEADALLDADEAEETIDAPADADDDVAMDSGDEEGEDDGDIDLDGPMEEILLQNDSAAHFDQHSDSILCIAQHPTRPEIVATGGQDDAAYVWDATPAEGPVLPTSYESDPQPRERQSQRVLATLEGQDESVNAICFTLPTGDFVATATLAGTLSVYSTPTPTQPSRLIAASKEVDEINWLLPSPHRDHPNTLALGAADGSVWVYTVTATELTILQTFFLHQAPCTAGAWTPDGKLLATVAEDSSLYVWDVFGDAAAAGVADPNGGQAVVSLTAADERFKVDGGLYSAAISPGGGIVAVGGAGGNVRVIGLPRLSSSAAASAKSTTAAAGTRGGSKATAASKPAPSASSASQAGQILAALAAQTDGVETLSFSQPPLTLLAAGSVDGSITLFDAARNFAVRRHIPAAHDEEAVIQVEFVKTALGTANAKGWCLTSCGNDGVVRRWDVRGGTVAADKGLVGEWRGHRGGGDGGGVLGFVQGGGGGAVVTAGDDGVGLVFATP